MENSIIDIRNLLWNTLKQWRKIVLGIFIGIIIVGGYGAYSTLQTGTVGLAETQVKLDEYNAMMEELELEYEEINQYVEESLYMSLDYLNIVSTMFFIYADAIEPVEGETDAVINPTGQLTTLYYTAILSDDVYQEINEVLGYSKAYTNEIFTVTTDAGTGFFSFTIRSNSQEDNEKVGEIISNYFLEQYEIINSTIYVHDLWIGDYTHTNVVAEDINNYITAKQSELKAAKEDVEELQEKISETQLILDSQNSIMNHIILVIIYILIGIILGGGAAIFFMLVMPLVLNKIQGGRYVELEHHLTVLATKPILKEGKSAIDKLIYKKGSKGTIRTEEDFLAYLIQSINVCTEEGETVHLTGTIDEEAIQALCGQIEEKVHVKLTYGGDIAGEIGSLAQVAKADSVILVEALFHTMDRALEREIYHINKLNKEIKGVVLL